MQQIQQKKRRFPLSFIVRLIAFIALNYSFIAAKEMYVHSYLAQQLAIAINTFLTASILISIGQYIIVALYKRKHAYEHVRGNFILGIGRVSTVLNALFLIIAIMIALGINPKEFVTSMTIVAMAIAVTFREYITNMISGLIIMFSDQFSIGDHIKIGDNQGKIVDITLANLVVKNEDDDAVLVPNNLVFTTTLVNKSSQKTNKLLVAFELPLSTSLTLPELGRAIKEGLQHNPDVIWDDSFGLKVGSIGKDYIKYKLTVSTKSSANKEHKRVEAEVLGAVLQQSQKATLLQS